MRAGSPEQCLAHRKCSHTELLLPSQGSFFPAILTLDVAVGHKDHKVHGSRVGTTLRHTVTARTSSRVSDPGWGLGGQGITDIQNAPEVQISAQEIHTNTTGNRFSK